MNLGNTWVRKVGLRGLEPPPGIIQEKSRTLIDQV